MPLLLLALCLGLAAVADSCDSGVAFCAFQFRDCIKRQGTARTACDCYTVLSACAVPLLRQCAPTEMSKFCANMQQLAGRCDFPCHASDTATPLSSLSLQLYAALAFILARLSH